MIQNRCACAADFFEFLASVQGIAAFANCMQFGTVEEMSKEVAKKGNRVIFVPMV